MLAVVAVAQVMVVLEATVVNVAPPTIQRDLGFSEQSLNWILNAYTHGNQAAEAEASADG